jgi:hypothetical protein
VASIGPDGAFVLTFVPAFGDLALDDPAGEDVASEGVADKVLAVFRAATAASSAMAAPGMSIMPAPSAAELNKKTAARRQPPASCFATIRPPGRILGK